MRQPRPMSQANFRWSKDDLRADYPKRFDAILDRCGCSFSGVTRALIRSFVDEVERRGLPLYRGAAKKVATSTLDKARTKQKRRRRR